MRFLAMFSMSLMVAVVAATPCFAQQACGPIVRCLEGDYFLVQCNGTLLQANDVVSVRRGGQEVARGRVMRSEGGLSSVLVPGGLARRLDTVYLIPAQGEAARGPALPTTYGRRGGSGVAPAATATSAAKTKRDDFFTRVEGGRVLNLNTGEFSTEK